MFHAVTLPYFYRVLMASHALQMRLLELAKHLKTNKKRQNNHNLGQKKIKDFNNSFNKNDSK